MSHFTSRVALCLTFIVVNITKLIAASRHYNNCFTMMTLYCFTVLCAERVLRCCYLVTLLVALIPPARIQPSRSNRG